MIQSKTQWYEIKCACIKFYNIIQQIQSSDISIKKRKQKELNQFNYDITRVYFRYLESIFIMVDSIKLLKSQSLRISVVCKRGKNASWSKLNTK